MDRKAASRPKVGLLRDSANQDQVCAALLGRSRLSIQPPIRSCQLVATTFDGRGRLRSLPRAPHPQCHKLLSCGSTLIRSGFVGRAVHQGDFVGAASTRWGLRSKSSHRTIVETSSLIVTNSSSGPMLMISPIQPSSSAMRTNQRREVSCTITIKATGSSTNGSMVDLKTHIAAPRPRRYPRGATLRWCD